MATEVIKIVDPDNGSGTNYTSLSAWEAGEQGDLTGARDEIAVAKCRCTGGSADTTGVYINGWTTSSTQYIKIWTDPSEGYRHSGKWSTGNKYRLQLSNYWACIYLDQTPLHIKIIGLQIYSTDTSGVDSCIHSSGATAGDDITVSHCVLRNTPGDSSNSFGFYYISYQTSGSSTLKIYNNIIYDSGERGLYVSTVSAGGVLYAYIYNNTIIDAYGYGMYLSQNWNTGTGSYYVRNNIIQGSGTQDYYVPDPSQCQPTTSKNITSDTSSPDSSYRSKTVSFADRDNDDFHLSSSDTEARGNGDNLYNDSYLPFQDDIDGQDRGGSGASWDIGADEYVAAGTSAYPYYAYAQQ